MLLRKLPECELILLLQTSEVSDAACQWGKDRSIVSSDLVFWMGDLNYRLNMPDGLVSISVAKLSCTAWHRPFMSHADPQDFHRARPNLMTGCSDLLTLNGRERAHSRVLTSCLMPESHTAA